MNVTHTQTTTCTPTQLATNDINVHHARDVPVPNQQQPGMPMRPPPMQPQQPAQAQQQTAAASAVDQNGGAKQFDPFGAF